MLAAMSLLLFLHNAIGIQELARKTMGVQATKIVGNTSDGQQVYECESPSLPRNDFHIVLGGYQESGEAGLNKTDNYLLDLGLTNADIFWYRRIHEEQPLLSSIQGTCGVNVHEKLLLPNYGRDGSAFYDHVFEVYHHPPRAHLFFARPRGHCLAYFLRGCLCPNCLLLLRPCRRSTAYAAPAAPRVRDHMMTLTSDCTGTKDFELSWFGHPPSNRTLDDIYSCKGHKRRRLQEPPEVEVCEAFLHRWNVTKYNRHPYQTCCASFILPGERIQRYPRAFWEDLQNVMTDLRQPDKSRSCWEFIIYDILGDERDQFHSDDLRNFYGEADGLVRGNNDSGTESSALIHRRTSRCQKSQGARIIEYTTP